jgi:hypothetical protein
VPRPLSCVLSGHGREHRRLVGKEGRQSRSSIAEFIYSKELDFGFQGLARQAEFHGCSFWTAKQAFFCDHITMANPTRQHSNSHLSRSHPWNVTLDDFEISPA